MTTCQCLCLASGIIQSVRYKEISFLFTKQPREVTHSEYWINILSLSKSSWSTIGPIIDVAMESDPTPTKAGRDPPKVASPTIGALARSDPPPMTPVEQDDDNKDFMWGWYDGHHDDTRTAMGLVSPTFGMIGEGYPLIYFTIPKMTIDALCTFLL